MKTILLATNLREQNTAVFDWARLFAHHYNSLLLVLHVQQTSKKVIGRVDSDPVNLNPSIDALIETAYPAKLRQLATQFQREGIHCQVLLRQGNAAEVILATAQQQAVDLILMGHDPLASIYQQLLTGSVALNIARRSRCPVLIAPTDDREMVPGRIYPRTIVYTTSLAFKQPTPFTQVIDMVHRFGSRLRLLHIQTENRSNKTSSDKRIAHLQHHRSDKDFELDWVNAPTVVSGIDGYLSTTTADLLVMTTHERDFISGLLNPSLTGRMISRSTIPILVYHLKSVC
ncbi:universal stress protein [Spirosoma gilvum]